jgi:hypothetical protein
VDSGTPHILLEIYVPCKGVDRKLKESRTLKMGQHVSLECWKYFTDCKTMSLRWEGSIISPTNVVYKTVMAYICGMVCLGGEKIERSVLNNKNKVQDI